VHFTLCAAMHAACSNIPWQEPEKTALWLAQTTGTVHEDSFSTCNGACDCALALLEQPPARVTTKQTLASSCTGVTSGQSCGGCELSSKQLQGM
jgi:hypothetical protein